MSCLRIFSCTWGFACALAAFAPGPSSVSAAEVLTIGSNAPALDIEHWVQDGKGKFKPVTKFEKGKVYVVEFWATWCGPCVSSMPHLAELQNTFAAKGVQIVSISDEPRETVEKFLDRALPAKMKPKRSNQDKDADSETEPTFRELTSAYCLTTDPDQSSSQAYMEAAGQNGIPCAFVVGKDQKIEWIGHPMELDDVLNAIVDNRWDRNAFADKFKEQQMLDVLRGEIAKSMRSGKIDKALARIDAAIKDSKEGEFRDQLKMIRLQIVLSSKEATKDVEAALTEGFSQYADNAELINVIAWTVYEKVEAGEWTNKDLVKLSRIASLKSAANPKWTEQSMKASILDTAAHLQFLEGDVVGAIKTQEKAIETAEGEMKKELSEFLSKLKEESKK